MKYSITERDKKLLLQCGYLHYKLRVTVTNDKRKVVDVLYGISDTGGIQIDADSNIRRTFSFTLRLEDFINNIESKIASWIGLYYEVDIGVQDARTDEYVYYPNGRFRITETSTTYDAVTNSISFSLSDRVAELDGTRNGQIGGAPVISIPKETDDGKKRSIRSIVISLITDATAIDKYIIDDIGEFYGMPQNNKDYADYRQKNDEWNILPYDLEYSAGAFVSDMLFEIRDLYPNCQMYFDVYDNFCFDMIPSLDNDIPDINYDYLEKILIANNTESVTYDITSIKNVTEVFGKTYDVKWYTESSTFANNTYSITIDGYGDQYVKYDMVAFIPVANNQATTYVNVNGLGNIPIYLEYTDRFVTAGIIEKDTMCVIKIYKNKDGNYIAYYLGQYQPHTLCVLTDNQNDEKYTKEYFSKKYNVAEKNIVFREEPFSPFTVQKHGEILDVKSGDIFDNIISDSVAIENAKYYNRLSSTMFDTVTITTKLIPWLDVNVKVNYRKLQENNIYSYVVKNRSDDFANGTSTITMYRFLQLYEENRI